MRELWKEIEGFERYSISNQGRVRNDLTNNIIKARNSSNGYLRVGLRTGKHKYESPVTHSVHRLVAEHFIERTDLSLEVNHINGIKHDNKVQNLEWVTAKYNIEHAIKNGFITPETLRKNIENITSKESKRKSDESHRTPKYRVKMQKINRAKGVTKPIKQICIKSGAVIEIFDNAHEAARKLFSENFTTQDRLISRVARKNKGSAYGFEWRN